MKEYKFRAKCLDGNLITFDLFAFTAKDESCNVIYVYGVPIDASTIRQFTGLKDKNGTEIYEGDKIKKKEGAEYIGEVIFGKRTLGFGIHVKYLYHEHAGVKYYRDKFYRLNKADEVI